MTSWGRRVVTSKLKGFGFMPRVLVTDKLRSYSATEQETSSIYRVIKDARS
ncbi:hypothetical protein AVDCRST_MAG94-2518 [uncultured Leptolyngbya sp.]|uniref:Uncharacterized protein n=1 Tax=uncultured Leptolyngbya sp. TaxID=332963 RepID=A0A6J4LZ41_9CYAN|nr:hypothetical protein AVDCRST_MAG94-2518 [uncultured Leptolyngbya sp.]